MHKVPRVSRQRGAVLITVCLVLLFLLGFMAFALDFNRLFVVRTELQTAMDSCALAAAQELDGQSTSITRAINAGTTAGNLNRVNMQSASWDGQGQITPTSFAFMDGTYTPTTTAAAARYVECSHTQPAVRLWLLQSMGAFMGRPDLYGSTGNVTARAVATRTPSQTACPIPVALHPKTAGAGAPNFGYTRGEWISLLMSPGAATNGYIGWANLDGSNSASETEYELSQGTCGVKVGDALGTPGVQTSVADVWNARFGIYKNGTTPATDRPDFTGYAYTTTNWPSGANAYDGPTPAGAHPTAANFVTKRLGFASCADTGTSINGPNGCATLIGRSLNSFTTVATPGVEAPGGYWQYGLNRRLVLVPVTDSTPGSVNDYACMLMLQPLSIPMGDVQLEFIGQASEAGSPCTTSGIPGGLSGPLVTALVR